MEREWFAVKAPGPEMELERFMAEAGWGMLEL